MENKELIKKEVWNGKKRVSRINKKRANNNTDK